MGAKAYTREQKAEAVALAHVMGYEPAANQLGIDPRTVLRWMRAAGKAPHLDAPAAGWQQLMELAQAKVAKALASGKVTPVQAATIAGIASRNAVREPNETPAPKAEADQWIDQLEAELEARGLNVDLAIVALISRHQDHGCRVGWDDKSYPECPEPPTTIEDDLAYVLSLGDLSEWWERRAREKHEDLVRQLETNRQIAEAAKRRSLDAETEALVAAAEAFLAEGAGDAAA